MGSRIGTRIGDRIEVLMTNHPARNRLRKLLNLSSNVVEKGIAGPAADEFDGVGRDAIEVHAHGCESPDEVKDDSVYV